MIAAQRYMAQEAYTDENVDSRRKVNTSVSVDKSKVKVGRRVGKNSFVNPDLGWLGRGGR